MTDLLTGYDPADPLAPTFVRSRARVEPDDPHRLGNLTKAYLIWLSGGSCDGCTVATAGATHPRLEQLLTGEIPGLPRVELIHVDLAVESGDAFIANLHAAEQGQLDAPYVLVWEGSVFDESTAGDGYWGGLGTDAGTGRQLTSAEWVDRLAPGAAAVLAVGTCAAWGGIPAAAGNPTGSRGLGAHLGPAYRSAAGLPVVNIPGCAPIGDNVLEAAAALLAHLNGLAPVPALDAFGRPAWLYSEAVALGPAVDADCNIGSRGAINGVGGCLSMGGICIGCTSPDFPVAFSSARQRATELIPVG